MWRPLGSLQSLHPSTVQRCQDDAGDYTWPVMQTLKQFKDAIRRTRFAYRSTVPRFSYVHFLTFLK